MSWLVVGISGVTCGGKSTLAKGLVPHFNDMTKIIHQDDYFFPEDSPKHILVPGLNHSNWDVISSVDMEKMMRDIHTILQTKAPESPHKRQILLVEGFTLYEHKELEELCDLKFFFTLNKEDCWERRRYRTYEPPDPEGYFDLCVWPMYEQHFNYVCTQVNGVTFLEGTVDPIKTLESVLGQIRHIVG
ncbi:nicotinamide riboside kinase 1 [Oratosquilla oratoria]|uniref:nicotinamide riboside kinase 1 n=1 Tax=Oratosquilla oratoria TaxID=337810 RepID=UPI003F76AC47